VSTFLVVLLAAVAGFVAGWAAHRSEKRILAEARERYKAAQLAAELWACKQELALAEADAEAARTAAATSAPAAVHLHLPALPGGWPSGWPPMPVIDTLPASAMKEIR
jgi:ParB-like chromosome segregation protein Spo0J